MKQAVRIFIPRGILIASPGAHKVTLYVRSVAVPSGAFVDREGALHACAQARQKAFAGLGGAARLVGRVYPDADWQALCIAQSVQENAKVEIEVVDLAKGLVHRLRLRREGIKKTPQFVVDGQLLPVIKSPTELLSRI